MAGDPSAGRVNAPLSQARPQLLFMAVHLVTALGVRVPDPVARRFSHVASGTSHFGHQGIWRQLGRSLSRWSGEPGAQPRESSLLPGPVRLSAKMFAWAWEAQFRPFTWCFWFEPVRRRRMPPAAPARTASTLTTGLANAR